MASSFEVFSRTIQIGEKLLGLSYSDYRDAYDFSAQHFSVHSEHFLDYYENHSELVLDEYEFNLIRYFFIKAIEHRIASDLYANTSRGNVCDVFWSPFDIGLSNYPTSLPKHLEAIVNDNQKDAAHLANYIIYESGCDKAFSFGKEVLNAIQFLGQTVGYRIGRENKSYNGYPCSEMLTRNELDNMAGENLCNWMERNGFEIESANFTRDTHQNIIATKDGQLIHVLLSAEIAPEIPSFRHDDLDYLYIDASRAGAIPFTASVSLASADEEHFNTGIILCDDQTRYRVNWFGELEAE